MPGLPAVDYIDTPAALTAHRLSSTTPERLAIDTEFVRERTYFAKPCLIQTADSDGITFIDAHRLPSLEALKPVLSNPACVKILHSAGQDFEVLHSALGLVPSPVFDTQIAAALLGFDDQTSYAALVKQLLDVDLAKTETRTDWCRRPLTAAQLDYAADDVRYLPALHDRLHARLAQMDRLAWLEEDVATLARSVAQPRTADDLLQRVGGQRGLDGLQRAVVRALAAWREAEARRRDLPRKWVLTDEVIVELARRATTTPNPLLDAPIDALARELDCDALAQVINSALDTPPEQRPAPMEATLLDGTQKRLLSRLQDIVHQQARQLGTTPARLASRKDLERLVRGERDLPQLRGWRRETIGDLLLGEMPDRSPPDHAPPHAADSPTAGGPR